MVELVILDVNETLCSLDVVAQRLDALGSPSGFDAWFSAVLRDGFAASAAGRNVPFVDIARHHVAALRDADGVQPSAERIEHVLAGFSQVRMHDDVAEGLQVLADAHVEVVTLTNGSVSITQGALERAGLRALVAATHDVEGLGGWKPVPATYLAVVEAHGCVPGRSALLAVHPWDVQGAQAAGLIGAWLDRDAAPYPAFFPAPDVMASTLPDLARRLVGRTG
jgi:2-haloacid dehalogenase